MNYYNRRPYLPKGKVDSKMKPITLLVFVFEGVKI